MNQLAPPKGFTLYDRPSPLLAPWAPIYARQMADKVVLGLYLDQPHLNGRGTAHGGLIAALADTAMGISCGVRLRAAGHQVQTLWTTSLSVDYLGKVVVGQWLSFTTAFARVGKTLCHAEADIAADWETVARARGAFRVALARGPDPQGAVQPAATTGPVE